MRIGSKNLLAIVSGSAPNKCIRSRILVEKGKGKFSVIDAAILIQIIGLKQFMNLVDWVVHARFLENPIELLESNGSFILCVKILEHLNEDGLLGKSVMRALNQLVFELFLKSTQLFRSSKVMKIPLFESCHLILNY